LEVAQNTFYGNEAGYRLQKFETRNRASAIYITGGHENKIESNTFERHRSSLNILIDGKAPGYISFMPTNYFDRSHSSLIYINFPEENPYD